VTTSNGGERQMPAGIDQSHAAVFLLPSVARAYRHRPPYPAAVPDVVLSLLGDERAGSAAVLDVGCGIGDLARLLVDSVGRVDAVDVSEPMLEEGRRQPGGDHPGLRWISGRVEEAPLEPPYAIAVAGDSLNWTDWYVALPRLHECLDPEGLLVIVHRTWGTRAPEEADVFRRHSTAQGFQPYDLVPELVSRDLFEPENHIRLAGTWRPTIEEYVESRHAQASFSRERMGPEAAEAFDTELAELLRRLVRERRVRAVGEQLMVPVTIQMAWGRPKPGPS
jgi:SAM-dependent methyltransferase